MAGTNAKTERNNVIKDLWYKGELTQKEIGVMHGLTQMRVNAIIFNRKPPYRYCNYCGTRLPITSAVCDDCRNKHRLEREERRRLRIEARAQARQQRLLAAEARKEVQRKEREAKIVAKEQDRQRRLDEWQKQIFIKNEKNITREQVNSRKIFKWQSEGRENTRFLVRMRDNFTCQSCGLVRTPEDVNAHNKTITGRKGKIKNLDVHHLGGLCGKKSRGYDSKDMIPTLITLCHKCHYNHPEHTIKRRKPVTTAQNSVPAKLI